MGRLISFERLEIYILQQKGVVELMVISTGRVPHAGVWLKLNNIDGL